MTCPNCARAVNPESFFCSWCNVLLASPSRGTRAGLFARWMALMIDPLIGIILYVVIGGGALAISETFGTIVAFGFPLAYLIWFLLLLREGLTPGKRILGLRVVRPDSGEIPGFGTMFVREFVGRFVSGLFLGLGYLWAIIDRNGQAWHDKIARTVVVRAA
ncbi:MAG: RDD family protein [Gemmatimonadaceae bacterium]|nr:RDD family protein [Gemmatimonadaceae bacterium]